MQRDIDLHGLSERDAKTALERFIVEAPADCDTILVIHGHRHGDSIARMVRDPNALRSRRIVRRKRTRNPGETVLVLDV